MPTTTDVGAYRPLAVLLGGPFAPQRLFDPKPVVCALFCRSPRAREARHLRLPMPRWVGGYQAMSRHG